MSFKVILRLLSLQLVLSSLFIFPQKGLSQNVYQLKYQTDIPISAIGLGSLTTSFFLSKKCPPPTEAQLQLLKREAIWKLDRSATNHWSPKAATASDVLLYSSIVSPGLLFINKNVREEHYVSLMYLETMVLTAGLTNLTKGLAKRWRPYAYNEYSDMEHKLKKDTRFSFFSGHTSLAASSSFFLAKVYTDLNPNSTLKPLVWTTAALVPAIVGLLRYFAGKHYPTDIIVGYATGAAVGFFVPYIHQKKEFRP